MKISQPLVVKTVCVTFVAATVGWLFYFAGTQAGFKNFSVPQSNVVHEGALFSFEGQDFFATDLSEESQALLEAAQLKAQNAQFALSYDLYRTRMQIIRTELVSKHVQELAKESNISIDDAKTKIVPLPEVSRDEARALFQASDPQAKLAEFVKIEPELKAYIAEVKKREAFEKTTDELVREGEAKFYLKRPVNEYMKLDVDGFPRFGKSNSAHKAIVFVDYFCENCSKFNVELSKVAQEYESVAEFIFVPFPYTRPDRSLSLARGAICADKQKRYLDFHMASVGLGDLLKDTSAAEISDSIKLNPKEFSRCYIQESSVALLLQRSQILASSAGLLATPAVVLDSKLLEGEGALSTVRDVLESSMPMAHK